MATGSLGTLSVDVIANIAGMVSDLGKAQRESDRAAKAMQRQWQESSSAMEDALKGFAQGLIASLSIGSLIAFGKQAIDTGDQINKMAQKIGIGAESLSALAASARLSDVDLESFGGSMAKLARTATEAAAGSKQQAAAFQAIGVSVKDASGNMRPMQEILQDVANKMATYKDSASKTALAQELFGKSGAQLIPMLNDLGTRGFAAVRKEAEAYNQVIGPQQAKQSEEFNDNLLRMQMSVQGFANAVLREALPSLVDMTHDMAESAKTADGYADSSHRVANVVIEVVALLRDLGSVLGKLPADINATAEAFSTFADKISGASGELVKLLDLMPKVKKDGQGLFDFGGADGKLLPGVQQFRNFVDWLTTPTQGSPLADKIGLETFKPQIEGLDASLKLTVADVSGASREMATLVGHVAKLGEESGKANAPIVANAAAISAAAAAARKLASAQVEASKFLATLDGIGADKYTKAWDQYNSQLDQADVLYKKLKISGASVADATDFLAKATAKAKEGFDALVQAMRNANDADAILSLSYAKAESDLNNQIRLLGLDEEARKADELATRLITQALGDLKDFMGPLTKEQQDMIDKLTLLAKQTTATTSALERQKGAVRDFTNIWVQAGNSIADALGNAVVQGGNFLKSLVDIAKQVVQQIISYFLKLAVINPILNSLFGGTAGWTQLATMGGGGGFSLASLGASAVGGGGGGGSSALSGGIQAIFGAGSNQTITGSMFGSGEWDSGIGSTVAPYLGAAAGIYAGYNRYQSAGGGAAGVAGGAAYGLGTYAAGAGLASAAAGTGFAAGVSGAFAIPVVGWIALAAMLIDKFSGGKLFGTKGQVQSGVSTLSIGAGGADYSTFLALKGQSALFGGAKWSTENVAQTPEEKAAAQAFFESMTQTMAQYAAQFGADAGQLVAAKYGQQFDKHGNPTGVTSATIAGHEYANLKPEEFQQAYISANELAILSQFDSGLNATIEQYRASVDQLNAIAAGLSQAQAMFQAGGQFLAIAGDQTLSAVVHLAEGVQQAGETIGDTIARLVQAQAQYDQFVAQFKPAATYTSAFEQALVSIHSQMLANANQANALARAAGAEHASEQDLINIHNLAAQQFAAAVAQLQANANSLAASLGYAMPQSLDQINARIAELQGQANSGASAIGNFSNAMSAAAQRAQEAMNLLLGDLSPLNDQQKLQTALEGLRAGTASAEQVLQIGRQLYATGSDYNALFARVMAMARGGLQATNQGGGGGAGNGATGNSQELADLMAQRDAILAAQQHAGSLELAQEVADLVSASQGGTIQEALTQIGITDLGPFMQELGISNQADFEKFIQGLEHQTDSAGDNAATLSDDIQSGNEVLVNILAVLQQIASASGGPAGTPSSFGGDAGDLSTAMRDLASTMRDRNFSRGRSDRESTNFSRVR